MDNKKEEEKEKAKEIKAAEKDDENEIDNLNCGGTMYDLFALWIDSTILPILPVEVVFYFA